MGLYVWKHKYFVILRFLSRGNSEKSEYSEQSQTFRISSPDEDDLGKSGKKSEHPKQGAELYDY